mmetsp:Transcript_6193/g.9750  ORF Transcript_6193/g.9750 Transcript_6193/m.9750 type:complete len:511 (+) Transcript_6193:308-1840(+)
MDSSLVVQTRNEIMGRGWTSNFAVNWKHSGIIALAGLSCDIEIEIIKYMSPVDLARLAQTSKTFYELVQCVCEMGLRQLLSLKTTESVRELPLVMNFKQIHGQGLTRLLHVLEGCKGQLFEPTTACGEGHSCLLRRGKTGNPQVFTFGDGGEGQLGTGELMNNIPPRRLDTKPFSKAGRVISVACGAKHTCLLTDAGNIVTFGENSAGQLGDGTLTSRSVPSIVPSRTFDGETVRYTQVVAGARFTAALTTTGRVIVFGQGLHAKSLYGSMLVKGEIEDHEFIVQISAGGQHLLMLTNLNRVYAVGDTAFGKLGLGADKTEGVAFVSSPTRVCFDQHYVVTQVSAGGHHSAIVTADGAVFTWGTGRNGELGIGKFVRECPTPTRVVLPQTSPFALQVSCGESHTAILTTTSRVVTFGSGAHRQDGKDTRFWATNKANEIALGDLGKNNRDVNFVVCGGKHTLTTDTSGDTFAFGDPASCGRPLRSARDAPFLPKQVVYKVQRTCFRSHSL